MAQFSEILKELREKRGMSQPDLAEKIGVTRVSISNYENGKATPNYEGLVKLADIFNVTTDYLLGRQNADKHYTDHTKPDEVQERFFKQLKALIMSNSDKLTEVELEHIAEYSNYIVTRDRDNKK